MNAAETSHPPYDELAVGHALSALEPEDEQRFLAHLVGCAVCERALAEHTETLGHVAYDAASEVPPPSIQEGIRAGVAASGRAGTFPAPLSLDVARTRRQRTVRMMTAAVGAAAAVVLVISLTVANRGLSNDQRDAQINADKLRTAVSQLLVPGARKIDLVGDGGRGAVIVNGQDVSLVMSGIDPNDTSNSVYVLWEQTTFGDVRAVGAFDVRSAEVAVVNGLRLDQPVDTVKTFMVTKEDGRVAPARTTQPVVVAGDA
ncbi:MAG: anti-sigma factor [Frankiaceae bacterium]|nr:anti-sigma factor [Frankiaceae bacterium]